MTERISVEQAELHRLACAKSLAETVMEWLDMPDSEKKDVLSAYRSKHGSARTDEVIGWVREIKRNPDMKEKLMRLL
jgi:predicted Fe-S protein YdhL (DUF1289 family)